MFEKHERDHKKHIIKVYKECLSVCEFHFYICQKKVTHFWHIGTEDLKKKYRKRIH